MTTYINLSKGYEIKYRLHELKRVDADSGVSLKFSVFGTLCTDLDVSDREGCRALQFVFQLTSSFERSDLSVPKWRPTYAILRLFETKCSKNTDQWHEGPVQTGHNTRMSNDDCMDLKTWAMSSTPREDRHAAPTSSGYLNSCHGASRIM